MNFTNLVGQTGIKQHALGGRRFTRVNMGHYAYIAVTIDWSLASHFIAPVLSKKIKRDDRNHFPNQCSRQWTSETRNKHVSFSCC